MAPPPHAPDKKQRGGSHPLVYLAERDLGSGLSDPGIPNPYALLAAPPSLGERVLGRNGAGSLELPACPVLGSSWPADHDMQEWKPTGYAR